MRNQIGRLPSRFMGFLMLEGRLFLAPLLAFAATLLPIDSVSAQTPASRNGWRLAGGIGVYEVDELVGTPLIPMAAIGGTIGSRAVVNLELTGIFNKGFYHTDAIAGDLDLGIRFPVRSLEVQVTAGPTGILGGDSDGTPYTGGGLQGAIGLAAWAGNRVGFVVRGRARHWWGTADGLKLGFSAGILLRL